MIGDSHAELYVMRDVVCERVVVATEMREVPDPNAPKIEQPFEIVDWVCPDSILEGLDDDDN